MLTARIPASRSGWRSARRGSGLGPRSLALLTSRSRRAPTARAGGPRCWGSAGAPGGAVADRAGEVLSVLRIGDVAGDGGDEVGVRERGDGGGQPVGVAAVGD